MAKELAKKYQREIVTVGLILVGVLVYLGVQQALAADMDLERDVLSTSAPATNADHTIYFRKTTTWAVDDTLVVEIDEGGTAFTIPGGLDVADIDFSYGVNGTETEAALAAAAGASTWGVTVDNATDRITFITPASGLIPAQNDRVIIEIGDNATGGAGNDQIQNPNKSNPPGEADVYTILITYDDGGGGTAEDTGRALVAIIEGVTVSARVGESLSFFITGLAGGVCDTAFGNVNDAQTVNNTTIDFGSLTSTATFYHGCQDLSISTNGPNGYTITSQENDQLTDPGPPNSIPDTVCDAACTEATARPWADANNFGFGHTCSTIDGAGGACNTVYSAGNSYRQFASIADTEIAQNIMARISAPVLVTERGRVEYKISISSLQPSGLYANTITYIATANF